MSLKRYLNYSLAIHGFLLGLLVILTYALPHDRREKMRFVILPKGTSLDAVLTPELAKESLLQSTRTQESPASPHPTQITGQPSKSPVPTHPVTPEPTATVASDLATPSPTTLRPTPTPAKTVVISPRPSATQSAPAARHSPSPSSPRRTTHSSAATPHRTNRPTPRPSLTATRATSAYGADSSRARVNPDLPRRLPAGVTPRQATPAEEVGVPGVPEGVEGAPLPLDRTQSRLSMLYATRARMKIQSNFTVPPDVNDPNLTCVLEWEITSDGTIRNVRVVKSSGVPRLDACALDALRKTENLGPLPLEWGNRSVWTSLTFVFAGDHPVTTDEPAAPASANPRTREP